MTEEVTQSKKYALFDRSTVKIIGTYTHYDAGTRSYIEQSPEQVREAYKGQLGERSADEVDVIEMEPAVASQQHLYYIDAERRQFVPKLRIQLQVERTELQGDGQDAVEITICVLDNEGNVVQDFNGELRVTTTRGRLSQPGGRVAAYDGLARIKLTSVPETVARVTLTTQDPAERCISDSLSFEFL